MYIIAVHRWENFELPPPIYLYLLHANSLIVGPEDKHAELNGAHDNVSRLKEGVVVPRSKEESRITIIASIEESNLRGLRISNLCGIENPQTRTVVGEISQVAADVEVVVNGSNIGPVRSQKLRILKVLHAPQQGSGVLVSAHLLIELVIEHEVLHVSSEEALVRVEGVVVTDTGENLHVGLVRHINDGERVLVVAKADLAVLVARIGAIIDDTLGIMHIPVLFKASGIGWVEGIIDIHNMEATAACLRSDQVCKACLLIDDNIVGGRDSVVDGILCKLSDMARGLAIVGPELGEIHDLHAVGQRLSDDEDVVHKDLHVGPNHGVQSALGEEAKNDWVERVSDLDKGRAVLQANDGNLIASLRICPAPRVGGLVGASELRDGDEGEEVDVVAVIVAGLAINTLDLGHVGAVPGALAGSRASGMVLELALHQLFHAGVEGSHAAGGVLAARGGGRYSVVSLALEGVGPRIVVHVAVGEEVGAVVPRGGGGDHGGQEQQNGFHFHAFLCAKLVQAPDPSFSTAPM